jgi:hypothetical protein
MSTPVSNKQVELVTLGGASMWINGLDVGYIQNVKFECGREYVDFTPSGSLGPIKTFRIGETFTVMCQSAELRLSSIRLALGVTTNVTASYEPAGLDSSLSFNVDPADKWDSLTFGGSKSLDDFPLKLEHERPDGNKVIICLYKAQCISPFTLPFSDRDVMTYDLNFRGMADLNRAIGDQVGVIYEQVA